MNDVSCKAVLTFESIDENVSFDHSNETYGSTFTKYYLFFSFLHNEFFFKTRILTSVTSWTEGSKTVDKSV